MPRKSVNERSIAAKTTLPKVTFPHRWKYPLHELSLGATFTSPVANYWPLNAARTRAEQATGKKFSLTREANTVTVTRMK